MLNDTSNRRYQIILWFKKKIPKIKKIRYDEWKDRPCLMIPIFYYFSPTL